MRLTLNGAIRVAALILACGAWEAAPARAQDQPAQVGVDAVIVEPLSQTMPVLGRFVARQSGPVAALVSGPVESVIVEVGDRVEAGDVLVRLDTDRAIGNRNLRAAELKEMQAALETAKAQQRLAQLELSRLESLKKSPAFSQARFDDKTAEVMRYGSLVAEADAAIMRAQANLDLAELDVDRAEIRAPYDGVVVLRHTVDGAYVAAGAPVVTLVNDGDLEIEADVPGDRIGGVVPGREVRVRLDSGLEVEADVRAAIPTENALTRTRPVRFTPDLDGVDSLPLATDQSVTVLIPIDERREVVTVHKDAVISGAAGSTVFVVEEGRAQPRLVRLGEAVGNRFEVIDGLEPGELAVILGNERLQPGQAVRYKGMPPAQGDG